MKYFHEGIKDVKCIKMIYPKWENSTKAGWYSSRAVYVPEENQGIDVRVFAQALIAETTKKGFSAGCNFPLHWSTLYDTEDIFGDGVPPCRRGGQDPKKLWGKLPVSEATNAHCMGVPWFRYFDKAVIDRYIEATHKVVKNAEALKKYTGQAAWAYWDNGWQRDI
jgi:hypothetical protein